MGYLASNPGHVRVALVTAMISHGKEDNSRQASERGGEPLNVNRYHVNVIFCTRCSVVQFKNLTLLMLNAESSCRDTRLNLVVSD